MTIERNSAVDTLAERLEALAEWNDSTPPSHTTTVAEMFDRLVGRGLNAEQVVAVHLPRSAEMVVSVLAIMVAGGASCRSTRSGPSSAAGRCSTTQARC